jgi:UDP-N-acetylmuramoyl-L-alanyl-D-glutamate--2,6-diaminopimelate ligase
MVALAMAHLAGLAWDEALALLAEADGAPGRLEPVVAGANQPVVLVDYAHTPDALARVLATVRAAMAADPMRRGGRLLCVFGAGGDRDRGKRPEMAAAVATRADVVIATSDNPRTEDPNAILDDIIAGLPAGQPHIRETDRRTAIERAVAMAGPADVIVIAGKGHEDYQIIGTEKIFFDDRVAARAALSSKDRDDGRNNHEVTR